MNRTRDVENEETGSGWIRAFSPLIVLYLNLSKNENLQNTLLNFNHGRPYAEDALARKRKRK